jgi:chemotaxis signal transduction protein
MDSGLDSYYRILQVSRDASVEEIKKSARKLLLKYHPDINPRNRDYFEERTKALTEAYRGLLLDRRKQAGAAGAAPAGAAPAAARSEWPEWDESIVFTLTNRLLAFPARHAKRIIRVKDIRIENVSAVSEALPYIAGMFYYGGEVAMLWNLYGQLGLREPAIGSDVGRRQIIVADFDESPVGFLVDSVKGMERLENVAPAPAGDDFGIDSAWLDGIAATDDGPVGLLNIKSILYTF